MPDTPSISIVIPVFNRVDLLEGCLADLAETAPAAEVVVVDDCSAEDVATIVGMHRDRLDISCVRTGDNVGFGRACNLGATLARKAVLVFLNSDTRPNRGGWLEALTSALDDPAVGAVGALLWYPSDPPTAQHAGMAVCDGSLVHLYRGKMAVEAPGMFRPKLLQAVTGACFAIRAEDFRALGGFGERYRTGYEDVDLCMRLRLELGKAVLYEPRAQMIHAEAQSPGRFDAEGENRQRFFARWADKLVSDYWEILRADYSACNTVVVAPARNVV